MMSASPFIHHLYYSLHHAYGCDAWQVQHEASAEVERRGDGGVVTAPSLSSNL